MTSTPPRSPVPASATGPVEPTAGADRFVALVDHARAAVQAALAADAAARAHRADAGQTVSSEDADETASTADPAVRPTQLEEAVRALLSGPEATPAAIQVVG